MAEEKKGTMTVEEAGHMGGQKERKLVEEGKETKGKAAEERKSRK